MGRLILLLAGAFVAVLLVLWVVHATLALIMFAVVIAIVLAVLRVAFWAGRRSRR